MFNLRHKKASKIVTRSTAFHGAPRDTVEIKADTSPKAVSLVPAEFHFVSLWFNSLYCGHFSKVSSWSRSRKCPSLIERVYCIKIEFFSIMKCSREMMSRDWTQLGSPVLVWRSSDVSDDCYLTLEDVFQISFWRLSCIRCSEGSKSRGLERCSKK